MQVDFTFQQISDLLDEKVERILDKKFDEKLEPIHQKLDEHTRTLAEHSQTLAEHTRMLNEHTEEIRGINKTLVKQGKTLKNHSKSLRILKKNQDVMLDVLNIEQMNQRKRLDRIEDRLSLASI